MRTYNYVQEAWEERFQINSRPNYGHRFAMGFVLGALMACGILLFTAASTAAVSF